MATEVNKEAFVELQGRLVDTDRKQKQVLQQVRFNETEKKHATLTLQELEDMPADTVAYKAIGKAFALEPLESLREAHHSKVSECDTNLKALQTSKEYLEKQMQEVQANFKELLQASPALMQQIAGVAP